MTLPNFAPPPRALLLTDEPKLARAIELALNHGAYQTRVVGNAEEAAEVFHEWVPHIAIIDLDVEGALATFNRSMSEGQRPPSVALTRRGDLQARLSAVDQGAVDVLTLPFAPEELLARVAVVMRRTYGTVLKITPTIKVHDLEINLMTRRVTLHGEDIRLTSLELGLLYLLAANAGDVVSREDILDHLWGRDYFADSNVIDRHIRNLRVKLRNNWRRPRYILTVAGRGYQFMRSPSPN